MPQLMPLNWMLSSIMFMLIILSCCFVYNLSKEKKVNCFKIAKQINLIKWSW